jgi:ABC-type antimicrobial peptide transport system permease subunit
MGGDSDTVRDAGKADVPQGTFVARVFTSLLAGLSALDPLTYAAVAVTMLSSAALAGLGAAWRLRRMTPTDALRAN